MRRIVINLDRNLPPRAARVSGKALAEVFGGCAAENGLCTTFMGSYGIHCCAGLTCRTRTILGVTSGFCLP